MYVICNRIDLGVKGHTTTVIMDVCSVSYDEPNLCWLMLDYNGNGLVKKVSAGFYEKHVIPNFCTSLENKRSALDLRSLGGFLAIPCSAEVRQYTYGNNAAFLATEFEGDEGTGKSRRRSSAEFQGIMDLK